MTNERTAAVLEARVEALEYMQQQLDAPLLRQAALTELQLLAELLNDTGYDRETGVRLHHLAARTAGLCAEHAAAFGDSAAAERFNVTSIQMSTTVGCAQMAAYYTTSLASMHLEAGSAEDSLQLVESARHIVSDPPPYLVALWSACEAQAWALLGREKAAVRALEAAFASYLATPAAADPAMRFATNRWLTPRWLDGIAGMTWFHLGEPRRALPHFASLLEGPLTVSPAGPSHTARELLYAAKAHLAAGNPDEAVRGAERAMGVLSVLPTHLLHQLRRTFSSHQAVPSVQALLARIAEGVETCAAPHAEAF
ncbi:hypothetical protein [Streptomyces sp. NPDC047071]|uniref:hypothetical protein n=1 Tax=Streptomyces sp. NPDC047071 TaxID=3154808 RepID=UPI0034567A39